MSTRNKEQKAEVDMAKKIVYETKQIGAIAEIFSAAELEISDILDTKELTY